MAKAEKDFRIFGRRGKKSTRRALHVRLTHRDDTPGVTNPASIEFTRDSNHAAVREAEEIVASVYPRELYRADVLAQRQRRRKIASASVGVGVFIAGVSLLADLIATSNPSTVLIPDGSNVVTTVPCPDISGTFVCPGGGRVTVGTGNNEGYLQVSTPASGIDRVDRSLNINQELEVQETDTSIITLRAISRRKLPQVAEKRTGQDGVTVFKKPDNSLFDYPCVNTIAEWVCVDSTSKNDQVTAFTGGNLLQLQDGTGAVPVMTKIPVREVKSRTVESYLKDGSVLNLNIGQNGLITNASITPANAFY